MQYWEFVGDIDICTTVKMILQYEILFMKSSERIIFKKKLKYCFNVVLIRNKFSIDTYCYTARLLH